MLKNVFIIAALCIFIAGCSDSLRFAPGESLKQNAELTHNLAVKVNAEGAAPQSEATKQLELGTRASVAYIGRPAEPPDTTQFDTISAQANIEGARRPDSSDVFNAAESGLSLAAELLILFGAGGAGFGGKKLLDWIALAKEKSDALKQIVQGNEIFKKAVAPEVVDKFKDAQSMQSPATKSLVAELKS